VPSIPELNVQHFTPDVEEYMFKLLTAGPIGGVVYKAPVPPGSMYQRSVWAAKTGGIPSSPTSTYAGPLQSAV
jgi:hypothetical protein